MSEKDFLNNVFHHYDNLKNAKNPISRDPETEKQTFNSMIYHFIRKVDLSKQDMNTLTKLEEILLFYKNHAMDFKNYEKDYSEEIIEKTNSLLDEIKVYTKEEKERMSLFKKEILEDKKFKWQKISVITSILAIVISFAALLFTILFNYLHG